MKANSENLCVNADDFRRSRWKAALESAGHVGYLAMRQALFSAARQARADGDLAEMKVLKLVANACSMILRPGSINDPFESLVAANTRRSALPEDFQEEDIELFSQIAEEIDDVWLRARIADLVWTVQSPRNHRFALLAIDAYKMIPLDIETWHDDGKKCWQRAICLTKILGDGAKNRLVEIETQLLDCLIRCTPEDGFLTLWLADLILETKIGYGKGADIAAKLEELGIEFGIDGELRRARNYFDASAKWFRKIGDQVKASEVTARSAETSVKEAVAQMSAEQPNYPLMAILYEDAIQKYRSIPGTHRAPHNVDQRIAELHMKMTDARQKALGQMPVITSPAVDISELIENVRNAVSGKTPLDGLLALANIYPGACVRKIRERAEKGLRKYPLRTFFSLAQLSRDGRVIAKSPGVNLGKSTVEDSKAVWADMVKHYTMMIGPIVTGFIWPALEVLRLEHRFCEEIFVVIANECHLVPPGRERLFGKALFAGYDGDFVSALHLLVPQIEDMVRWHLKVRGVKTTTLDSKGIETENALGTLMESYETNQVFGEDMAFEFKALLCDPFGHNLRNELAHGLLDYEACESAYAVYAWWLGLRIMLFAPDRIISELAETTEGDTDAVGYEK
jgi:hypothetical protein